MSSHPVSRPTFVGRVGEIARLRAALEQARSGRGGLVLLSGAPGIGKSRLAAEFVREASSAGVRVLFGRSWEAGGAPPFWPWVQAIRAYLRTAEPSGVESHLAGGAESMVTMLPELADLDPALNPIEPGDPASDRFRLFDSTTTFLVNIAETEPLVIVVEDLQAADIPSLLLLDFIKDHLTDASILIVATYRDVELTLDHPLTRILAELRRSPSTTDIVLRGLDADEVMTFLEATAGTDAASSWSASLLRRTSGNPLFLTEAVRLLTSGDSLGSAATAERMAIPAEIRTVIQRRVDVLSRSCRDLIESLSVLGNEFDAEIAARFAELDVEQLLDLLGEAVTAGLVLDSRGGPATFAFSHDLIRETLYAGISLAERIGLHRRAAYVLESVYGIDDSEHLAELALHHFEAAAGGDHRKAFEYGRMAGEQALRRLAYEEAVRLYEMAVQTLETSEAPDLVSLGNLLLSLGDARVRAGDLYGAGKTFSRAAEVARRSGDVSLIAHAAIGYGGRFVWARAGNDTEMVPLLQDALVMLGGEDDGLRVRLLSRLACATRSVWDREHSASLARQAVELARNLGDPPTLIYALSGLAGATWWPENPHDRVELGREMVALGESAGLVEGVIDGHMTLCSAFTEMGDFAAAREELRLLSLAGGSLGLSTQRWLEGAMGGVFALSDGLFAEAEQLIDEMLRKPPVTPARDNIAAASFQRFLLRREQGRLAEIESSMRAAAAEFPWYPIQRLALAELLRLTDRPGEARTMLGELAAGGFARFHRDNYWIPSMCLASEVVVGLEEDALARTLIDLLSPFAEFTAIGFPEGSLGSVSRYLGILSGLVGDHDLAVRRLEEALVVNERNGALPWVAHGHFDLGNVLIERAGPGDISDAEAHLRLAAKLCGEIGLPALQRAVDSVLDAPTSAASPESEDSTEATLRREGDYFSISLNGEGFRLKSSKGLHYIASLLGSPGREIHVLDLLAADRGFEPESRGVVGHYRDELQGGDGSLPVLDQSAKDAYVRRLSDLDEDIAEAERFSDGERAARAREEREFVLSELSSAVGLGGRDRPVHSQAERARVNVTRAIRSALVKIETNSPLLGRHLDSTIRTGLFCSYKPDPLHPYRWDL